MNDGSRFPGAGDEAPDFLRRFDEVRIGKVGVARRGPVPPVPEEFADHWQGLPERQRAGREGMAQVVQTYILQPRPARTSSQR